MINVSVIRSNWRRLFVLLLFFILNSFIIYQLYEVQIKKGDLYKVLAKGQQEFFQDISGNRGKIFCHDKDDLAILVFNKIFKNAYVVPKEIEDDKYAAEKIAEILNLDRDVLEKKFSNKKNQYYHLGDKLDEEKVSALEVLGIKGIYFKKETHVYYPYKELGSSVLGFVDKENNGKYGIQSYYNDILEGKDDMIKVERGILGYFSTESDKDLKGDDLILTIDINIQKKAEELLEWVHDSLKITEGQIIVMEPNTGKIIALADYPNYNPNKYNMYDYNVFLNGGVQKLYEPGSVIKPITMAIALNEGKVEPDTVYHDRGFIKIGKWTIKNYNEKVFGDCTMTKVLERSVNTGAVYAGAQVPKHIFLRYFEQFGFFEKTNIDLAGEVFDNMSSDLKAGRESSIATASYGQGVSITPLRLAVAYCALANGGKIVKPYIVEKIIKTDGNIQDISPQILKEDVISIETSEKIKKMLNSVTENGFSKNAQVPGYYMAGKTGTAQMPTAQGGYTEEETWQTFSGFGPAYDPKFVIIVKLDNPQCKEASVSAAPIFAKLSKYILDYYQIPTERDSNEQTIYIDL